MGDVNYPTVADIIDIHDGVVANDEDTDTGIHRSTGSIEMILTQISEGFYGHMPETIDEKAATLLRYLAAEQIFVDGEKRTALYTTTLFYALNGYKFDYDDDVFTLLERIAIDESTVTDDELIGYLQTHTTNK
jgi:death-on-curing protein